MRSAFQGIEATDVLESLPCAIAIWQGDGVLSFLNCRAKHLTGFSDDDFQRSPSLWISRIDPADRDLFSAAWKKLVEGERIACCDYHFLPKENGNKIWLREVSVSYQDSHGSVQRIISNYTDITDLTVGDSKSYKTSRRETLASAIDGLVHEIQNDLQAINMELDLMQLEGDVAPAYQPLIKRMEHFNKLIQELKEGLLPSKVQFGPGNPEAILQDAFRDMENELRDQAIRSRVVRRTPIPSVQIDLRQFRSAVKRIIEFCRSLLPRGGEIVAEVGLTNFEGQRHIEIKLAASSLCASALEERDGLQPFVLVNERQASLGLALAYQVLRRQHGKVFFQRESPQRGLFTILLKVR